MKIKLLSRQTIGWGLLIVVIVGGYYYIRQKISFNISDASEMRQISSIDPITVAPNGIINIYGINLDQTVQALDGKGGRHTTKSENTINSDKTLVQYKVVDLPNGDYTLRVGPTLSDFSNVTAFKISSSGLTVPTKPAPPKIPTPPRTAVPRPTQNGDGLTANYYLGLFKNFCCSQIDSSLEFKWVIPVIGGVPGFYSSPNKIAGGKIMPPSPFSVVWQGYIMPPSTGVYSFFLSSDDGAALSINGKMVVKHWGCHGPSIPPRMGVISMKTGEVYDIKIQYYQCGGPAVLNISWQGPLVDRQTLSAPYLYSNDPTE